MQDFETALQMLPLIDRDLVRKRIDLLLRHGSAIVQRFASNIENETRLHDNVWRNIFNAIMSIASIDFSSVGADILTNAIRGSLANCALHDASVQSVPSKIPVGPPIDHLYPQAYGRLITHRQLVAWWRLSAPARAAPRKRPILSTSQMNDFIEDLTTRKGFQIRASSPVLAGCPLGRFIIWSTYDSLAFGTDPFVPRPSKLSDLVATLGLDAIVLFGANSKRKPRQPAKPLTCVLLTYELPPRCRPHIPTIVEAYAGNGRMNYYFQVFRGSVDLVSGAVPRTMPAPSHQEHQGVPEVVHSIIFGNQLTNRLRVESL